jgi:hypothetical protein
MSAPSPPKQSPQKHQALMQLSTGSSAPLSFVENLSGKRYFSTL